MTTRRSARLLPLPFLALLGLGLALQPARQGVPYEARPVAGNVQWIEGSMGGNVALSVGDDGVFVIDSYLASAQKDYERAVTEAVGEQPVRMLLNTHWHADHTGNNASFGRQATILAHDNVRRRLEGDAALGGNVAQGTAPVALPTLTFDDEVELHLNGETVRVLHYAAGHTDGDSVAFFEGSKVLHTGDLFFNGRFPFIDLDSGGSVDGYVAAVEAVHERVPDGWRIIPGHGPLAQKSDLTSFLEMLRQTRGLVRESLEEGLTVEEMKARDLLGPWREWAWGFISLDRYLDMLVRGLQ